MEILFLIVAIAGFAFFAAVMVWADVYTADVRAKWKPPSASLGGSAQAMKTADGSLGMKTRNALSLAAPGGGSRRGSTPPRRLQGAKSTRAGRPTFGRHRVSGLRTSPSSRLCRAPGDPSHFVHALRGPPGKGIERVGIHLFDEFGDFVRVTDRSVRKPCGRVRTAWREYPAADCRSAEFPHHLHGVPKRRLDVSFLLGRHGFRALGRDPRRFTKGFEVLGVCRHQLLDVDFRRPEVGSNFFQHFGK